MDEVVEEMTSVTEEKSQEDCKNADREAMIRALVEREKKKSHKSGMLHGMLITIGVVVLVGIIAVGAFVITKAVNGTLETTLLSWFSDSILDDNVTAKVNSIYGLMETESLKEIDKNAVTEGIYKGMLESLDDPYSVYYTPEDYKMMVEDVSGTFEGIGAYLQQDPDTMAITIVRPMEDSPAQKVGMLAGDVVVEVGGEDVVGQDLTVVVSKIRGPKGSQVNIGVKREGTEETIYYDVTRDHIDIETVTSEMLDDNIGYILVSEFADATATQFRDEYNSLMKKGMKSLIIDMRENPGGYVDVCVEMADMLLPKGVVVTVKDRYGHTYDYKATDDDKNELPTVVLVDGNTASAAEIVTGALKDSNAATVIGETTFGKGIVQDIIPLGDGSGVKITTSQYFTPSGADIHKKGIKPDIEVELDIEAMRKDGSDNQLERAKKYLIDGK